jgi:hypothetical protein
MDTILIETKEVDKMKMWTLIVNRILTYLEAEKMASYEIEDIYDNFMKYRDLK